MTAINDNVNDCFGSTHFCSKLISGSNYCQQLLHKLKNNKHCTVDKSKFIQEHINTSSNYFLFFKKDFFEADPEDLLFIVVFLDISLRRR